MGPRPQGPTEGLSHPRLGRPAWPGSLALPSVSPEPLVPLAAAQASVSGESECPQPPPLGSAPPPPMQNSRRGWELELRPREGPRPSLVPRPAQGGERGPARILDPPSRKTEPPATPRAMKSGAWSVRFAFHVIVTVTARGKPRCLGPQEPPPSHRPRPLVQFASERHGASGRSGFVVKILTLEREGNYVQLLFGPQDSYCIIRISFNLWDF